MTDAELAEKARDTYRPPEIPAERCENCRRRVFSSAHISLRCPLKGANTGGVAYVKRHGTCACWKGEK